MQKALWDIGAFNGIKDRHGREVTLETAIDGTDGSMTQQALANAKRMGYVQKNNSFVKNPNNSNKTNTSSNRKQPVTTSGANFPSQVFVKPNSELTNVQDSSLGHAIYLHYPNFVGRSSNAIKIGNIDLGKVIGDPDIPVGHAATVLIGPNNEATYYEYGRYAGKGFGHVRPTAKGGNWQKIKLPPINVGENDSTYMARIQHLLPDTKTGAYQAMTIPNVDVEKATNWIVDQANNVNRPEYSAFGNTCANGACNAIIPFQIIPEYHSSQGRNNEGYSNDAKLWSILPNSTGDIASKVRKRASKVYTMNK